MDFIRHFIEQKISTTTGETVHIGKLSFSPLSGTVQVRNLSVGSFLTVRKVEAIIAVARALRQEIVVRSLAIEGLGVAITRSADGKLNLPQRPPPRVDQSGARDAAKSWEFEAKKVLLVGGRVQFSDASGYQISLENLTGSVEMKSSKDAEFIFAADSLGRRDRTVELGDARLLGKLCGALNFTLSAGSMLDLNLRTPAIASGQWDGEMLLALSLPTLLALLPAAVKLPITTATGDAKISVAGSFDQTTCALRLRQFELRTGPVTLR
jgi:hypothetical protein